MNHQRRVYENIFEMLPSEENSTPPVRIGERSSHTWFVLKYLFGLPNVRNYDGSWTEYGSIVGATIEKINSSWCNWLWSLNAALRPVPVFQRRVKYAI